MIANSLSREIEGWYPPGAPKEQQNYVTLVYEVDGHEILVDSFEVDGQEMDTKGPAFDWICDEAIQAVLEGDPDE